MDQTSEEAIRPELIAQANEAIEKVREVVVLLNEEEKAFLQQNSIVYRQLVDAVAAWRK